MKLKDFFNKKVNSRNNQISLDVKKRKLNKFDIELDELMELDVSKKGMRKFKEGVFDYE